jgi:putative flippase GtrA
MNKKNYQSLFVFLQSASIGAELGRFLFIGGLTVLIDWLIYAILAGIYLNLNIAKASGFVIGALFAFYANQRITFRTRLAGQKIIFKFLIAYILSLFVNVTINAFMLFYFNGLLVREFSFLVATATSASLNFFAMKYFVFR